MLSWFFRPESTTIKPDKCCLSCSPIAEEIRSHGTKIIPATEGESMTPATSYPKLEWEGQTFPEPAARSRFSSASLRLSASAGVSGILLWMCYFPLAWGWLAWVALVPMLGLVRSRISARWVFAFAMVGGLIFYGPVLQWMRVADPMMYWTWLALSIHCSLFVGVGLLLIRRLDRDTRLPLVLTMPAVWTFLEYLRSVLLTGFPWYFLGHTQHNFLPVIQIADLGGAYAVTFLVAAVNAWFFELLDGWGRFRQWLDLRPAASRGWMTWAFGWVAPPVLLALTLGYGFWRLGQTEFEQGPTVALLQGNLDQRLRNMAFSTDEDVDKAQQAMVDHYWELTEQAAKQQPELIVWPETSWPGYWVQSAAGQPDEDSRHLIKFFEDHWHTNVLLGLNSRVGTLGSGPRFNSAVLLQPGGTVGGRYDKIHRVPFGEYVPFRDVLPWMNVFAPYDFDYSITPGDQLTRLPLGKYHFGVLICFEDTDPFLGRQYVCPDADEPKVDFLVNISNDGWFNGTSEHEEHLANCRFRAVECRRAVARAVNMGISAVIDGNGKVLAPETVPPISGLSRAPSWIVDQDRTSEPGLTIDRWSEFKKVAGVLTAPIPIDHRSSLYARWGDWLPLTCGGLVVAGYILKLVGGSARRKQYLQAT
jgi:apolipoprotein N-acyltransferase